MSLSKEKLLEELSCKVCCELMVPPIYMCGTGHSICNQCYEKVARCPTCKNVMQSKNARFYSLEHIFNQTRLPCKNAKFGCTAPILGEQIKDHMKTCVLYQCPLKQNDGRVCMWQGLFEYLQSHAEEAHKSSIMYVNTVVDLPHFVLNPARFLFTFQHGHVFIVGKKLEGGSIQFCLQKIGTVDDANRYFLCVKFKNEDEQQFIAMSTCQSYIDDNKCFDSRSDCIRLDMSLLKKFCVEGELYFTIRIVKADDLDKCWSA